MSTLLAFLGLGLLGLACISIFKRNLLSKVIKNEKSFFRKHQTITLFALFFIVLSIFNSQPDVKNMPKESNSGDNTESIVTSPSPESIIEPSPTPEQKPTLTAEEQAYADKLSSDTKALQKAFSTLGKLSDDPMRIYRDQAFKNEIIIAMATVKVGATQAKTTTAPPKFINSHKIYVEAMTLYDKAMDDLAYGIDNADVDSINKANAGIQSGNARINLAVEEMLKVKN